jgi:hypothetical protein
MKRCKKCGEIKPIDDFYRATGMVDGHRSECKSCHRVKQRLWYQANREHAIAEVKRWQQENKEHLNQYRREYRKGREAEAREGHLRRKFGLTQADYDELFAKQGGGCRICRRPPGKISLHVDHDHETGEIRGLLCVGCNNALGQFHDDTQLLGRAITYVSGELPPLVDELEWAGIRRDRVRALVEVSG